MTDGKTLVIVAGPTASGKSALAMALATRLGGTIINADAMQCYQELRLITARPSATDEARVPHALYGVRQAAIPANAAWWRGAALNLLRETRTPILCGGTGMYLAALLNGIADVPDPGAAARAEARDLLATLGPVRLYETLRAVDPQTAARLQPGDSQRLARAYEVWRGTGRGLASWQAAPTEKLEGWRVRMILLDPARDALRAAIATRFSGMLAAGALDEVRAFLSLNLAPELPLMRAHGVPELAAHLRGETDLPAAAQHAVLATHQYTKRQRTWFRHQKLVVEADMHIIRARMDEFQQFSESSMGHLVNFINQGG